MEYLAWRVSVGLHKKITMLFLPVGHTKFAPDAGFGILKANLTYRSCFSSWVCKVHRRQYTGVKTQQSHHCWQWTMRNFRFHLRRHISTFFRNWRPYQRQRKDPRREKHRRLKLSLCPYKNQLQQAVDKRKRLGNPKRPMPTGGRCRLSTVAWWHCGHCRLSSKGGSQYLTAQIIHGVVSVDMAAAGCFQLFFCSFPATVVYKIFTKFRRGHPLRIPPLSKHLIESHWNPWLVQHSKEHLG